MTKIVKVTDQSAQSPFDAIRRFDENGAEFWYGRELMPVLGYQKWERFLGSIERAKLACQNSGVNWDNNASHLRETSGKTERDNYRFSRYACYMIAMNGDPRKAEIAMAQSYFAVKTRQAEVSEESPALPKSYAQALLEAGRLALALEKAEAEKALLEEQNEHLAEAVDELYDYSSIIRIAKFNNVCETRFKWQVLKAMSVRMGYEIKRVPCPRFEWKNLYHSDVWRVCYPDMKLPETTTLVIKQ